MQTRGSELQFRMLGQLAVHGESGEIDLGSPKQRAVLAVLLLRANEIVPVDRIIDLVWGDSAPRTAEHSVQIYISELRKSLSNPTSDELIDTRAPGYVINVPPDCVDILNFEREVRDGLAAIRAGDGDRGRMKLDAALATWRGEPLVDFQYEEFAQGYIRSLIERRSDALEALAALDLEEGDLDSARELARQAIQIDQLREEPRRVMMLSLYRTGRQADALRHYSGYRQVLIEELGIEPTEGLRLLEEQVLLGDPALDPIERRLPADVNPYRGLRAFSEADADVYFGRESLVEDVSHRLDEGVGFVSVVGPSGSGKSSAVQAGLIPKLRERGETVVVFQPGSRPLWKLAGALERGGFGTRASLARGLETDRSALSHIVDRPVVLVLDQFEELFTLSDRDTVVLFSELLANAIGDPHVPLRVVTTLRADYYDKPLAVPAFAGLFSDAVVSVRPMTPVELERAIVQPAVACGAVVEPALIAQLVADMADRPGALPLLQYTLFELHERSPGFLTLAGYQELGGLQGALSGGADDLLAELDAEGRSIVEQLMMRLVQKAEALTTSRPVPLRELLTLGVDRVALQSVLESFGGRRLITFDRDGSGGAIVEMAHEYLISEWPQMDIWLKAHSEDLDRLYSLDAAVRDWVGADRSTDYLLRGDRLESFERWMKETSLWLTELEREFVTSSIHLRQAEEDEMAEMEARSTALARSARRRLWALGSALAGLAAAITILIVALTPPAPPDVILWFVGGEFGTMARSGFDMAIEGHDIVGQEFHQLDPEALPAINDLVRRGTRLVMLGAILGDGPEVLQLIESNPETTFVAIDCQPGVEPAQPNHRCITSRHEEMGFLAGLLAALKTEQRDVGLLVGMDNPWMRPFQSGFEQGVEYVDPDIAVRVIYLSRAFDGFNSETLGQMGTGLLAREGADVIFSAAGESRIGMHLAAEHYARTTGLTLWTIGVDFDERARYESWKGETEADDIRLEQIQGRILSSVVKRLDLAIGTAIEAYLTSGDPGEVEMTIANGGLVYAPGPGADLAESLLEQVKAELEAGTLIIERDRPVEVRYLEDELSP